jgi:hypothetical protein
VNWKLILQLSMFGLAMGLGTVFVIPPTIEPVFWLVIFLVCAYAIARNCRQQQFLHGLLLGLANSVWITAAHILLFDQYAARHPQEVEVMRSTPMAADPRLMMLILGPVVGAISGIVMGVLAAIAGKVLRRASVA